MVGTAPGKMTGINFAIPVDTVKRVVTQIIRDGKTATPSVGMTVMDAALQEALEVQSSVMFDGAVIESVMPESPASEAGLKGLAKLSDGWDLGDLIVGADGKRVQKKGDFQSVLDAKEPGDVIQLSISRADDRSKHVVIAVEVTREKEYKDVRLFPGVVMRRPVTS
jgi:2-alkenal reductase